MVFTGSLDFIGLTNSGGSSALFSHSPEPFGGIAPPSVVCSAGHWSGLRVNQTDRHKCVWALETGLVSTQSDGLTVSQAFDFACVSDQHLCDSCRSENVQLQWQLSLFSQ